MMGLGLKAPRAVRCSIPKDVSTPNAVNDEDQTAAAAAPETQVTWRGPPTAESLLRGGTRVCLAVNRRGSEKAGSPNKGGLNGNT